MEMFFVCSLNMVATSHVWLPSPWNMATETEEKTFKSYFILIYLNVNSHTYLVASFGTVHDDFALAGLYHEPNINLKLLENYKTL